MVENSDQILRGLASPQPLEEQSCSSFIILKFSHCIEECLKMLYQSGKTTTPHYHLFLLLKILHLVLFKLLQYQGELSISGYRQIVFWWVRYGNRPLSLMKRSDLLFVRKVFVEIYFWSIFVRQFQKVVLLVLKQCGNYCVVIKRRWTPFEILGCAIDFVNGAQCKCKCKQLFVLYALLLTCQGTDYFQISSVGNCLLRTWLGCWRGGRWRAKFQLGSCTNQRWLSKERTHQQDVIAQWFVEITEFFPVTTFFTI